MALPSLSALKAHENSSNYGHHHALANSNQLVLASSLNLTTQRNHNQSTSDTLHSDNNDEKPVAVVHGKKNRLVYSHDEDEPISMSIKRLCFTNDRENSNVHILVSNNQDEHQCNDECYTNAECHLRHSSSVPDLRGTYTNATSLANNVSPSGASSPSSTSTSGPNSAHLSQLLSSQNFANTFPSNINNNILAHEIQYNSQRSKIESSKFQYVLAASTSMAVKVNEETMTYLNQGILSI